ncbi:TetR/AcrR family transcriptional regulator [Kitasatospora sp. NPDC001540]|uniref:TetR/AcrR family transcriptional regulator n=1 Tax=Kitasatospora sp. NPDC001540 TaxID=3364014 RepID=UPI0036B984AB
MTSRHAPDPDTDSGTGTGSGLVWERPEPPERRTPGPLSRALIVGAAVELADADGLEGVSIRRVAAVLEVGPMRLYGYVETKAELLELMVDAVYAEIAPGPHDAPRDVPPPAGPREWREELRELAGRHRAAALRHEWFIELLDGRPHLGPNTLAAREAALAVLWGVPGFAGRPTLVQQAAGVFHAYLAGRLRVEVAQRRAERAEGRSNHDWQVAMGPYMMRVLAAGRHPTIAEVMRSADHLTPGESFAAGLEMVLDGIAAQAS